MRNIIVGAAVLGSIFVGTAGDASARDVDSTEQKYMTQMEKKLVEVYFPPQGEFNFAGSTINVLVNDDGKARLDSIVQPPVVHGKRSKTADQALRSAVDNINPLEKPPKDVKLPAHYLVKFIVQAKAATTFRCEVRRI